MRNFWRAWPHSITQSGIFPTLLYVHINICEDSTVLEIYEELREFGQGKERPCLGRRTFKDKDANFSDSEGHCPVPDAGRGGLGGVLVCDLPHPRTISATPPQQKVHPRVDKARTGLEPTTDSVPAPK